MAERILSFLTANIGTKVISIVIAVVLWSVVLGSRNVEVTKEVPLEVITAADVVPANDIPEKIAFRLSGPKAFLRAILDRREDPIRVTLAGAKPGLVTYRFFSDNIRLPIGVKVLSISPASIPIKLEYLKRREVPVRVDVRGAPPEGFHVTKTEVRPSTVRIKGAESKVDGVTEIVSAPIDLSDAKQPVERDLPLDLGRYNVQIEGAIPRVLIQVDPTSANYRIRNVDVRVLTPFKYNVEEKNVTVLVRALPRDLKYLDRSRVYAVLDLRGRAKGNYHEAVRVTLPENVGLVRVIPDKINVKLY